MADKLMNKKPADTNPKTRPEQAGSDLKRRVEEHQFLTDHMADIIWTTDLNFQTQYISPSVKNILGFTQEERKLQSLEEMLTPESIETTLRILTKELEHEKEGSLDPHRSINIEVEYYKKDGSTIWMENHVKAIRDSEGQITGLLGVSRDISRRKAYENQLIASKKRVGGYFSCNRSSDDDS